MAIVSEVFSAIGWLKDTSLAERKYLRKVAVEAAVTGGALASSPVYGEDHIDHLQEVLDLVTEATGAKMKLGRHAEKLKGRDVEIYADGNQAGLDGADVWEEEAYAAKAKSVNVRPLPPGEDVDDLTGEEVQNERA